jgi:DNA-binding response OmpR family regulator
VNILLAEDDAVTRRVLISQLKKLGHVVTDAEDGVQGLALFQEMHPQVLITDWMMPNMDGPTLCQKIREEKTNEYTYIIILTALEKKIGYTEGMKAGADDFMTKPADIVELNVRLRVAERIVRLQKEVQQLKGLLPICSKCKRIRVADARWEQVESYITKRSVAQFSHGICPSCYAAIVQPQLDALKQKRHG